MNDRVREAIQALLDHEGDGWHLKDWVVVMGLERFDAAGQLEATAWIAHPPGQADYIVDGLISAAFDMRAAADDD